MICHNPFPMLRNWWCGECGECGKWIASVDMDMAQHHRKCKTRCR